MKNNKIDKINENKSWFFEKINKITTSSRPVVLNQEWFFSSENTFQYLEKFLIVIPWYICPFVSAIGIWWLKARDADKLSTMHDSPLQNKNWAQISLCWGWETRKKRSHKLPESGMKEETSVPTLQKLKGL